MGRHCGSECPYVSVTQGPANVSDTLIAPFLEPQYSRPYIQYFVSNLQPVLRDIGCLIPISVQHTFTF
jgi:hypothetical protein